MALQEKKYSAVVDLINQSGGRDSNSSGRRRSFKITAMFPTPSEKNAVWDKNKIHRR